MSSLVSGVGKIFSAFAPVAATLGAGVRAVGAQFFTAGAATGASAASNAGSGLFGSGILSRMFGGAASVVGASPAVSATSAAGATGVGGFGTALGGSGSFSGPWGVNQGVGQTGANIASAAGGLFPAATPTGFAAAGPSAGTGGFLDKANGFMNSPIGNTLLAAGAGYGEATLDAQKLQSAEDINAAQIAYHEKAAKDIRDSYHVADSSLTGPVNLAANAARTKARETWWHNPKTGAVEKRAVA